MLAMTATYMIIELVVGNITKSNITIIITRPKPAYGRQGLAGLWGQDTDQGGTFWDVLNVSLRASGAQLGYKLTWNHKKINLES